MGERVTLELPDELAQSAHKVAEKTHRPIEDVLLDWLGHAADEVPITMLSDEQVVALANAQMTDEEQSELSELLSYQREETLASADRQRLDELMRRYRHGMVRKAQALQVAIERGLLAPLN